MYIYSSVAKDGTGGKGVLARSNVKSGRQGFSPSESRACQPASALIEEEREGTAKEQRCSVSLPPRERERAGFGSRVARPSSRRRSPRARLTPTATDRLPRCSSPSPSLPLLARTPTTLRFVRPTVRVSVSSKQPRRAKDGRCVGPTNHRLLSCPLPSFGRSLPPRSADFQK